MKPRKVLIVLLLLLLLPSLAMAQTMYVKTPNGRALNMRSGASTDDPIIAQIHYGAAVTVVNDWVGSSFMHCYYKGHEGFVMARYLVDSEPKPYNPPTPKPTAAPVENMYSGFEHAQYMAVVTPSTPSTYVNLRWGPSKSTPVQTVYYANQPLVVLATNGQWAQVYDLNTNVCGFMMTGFLTYVGPYDSGALGAAQ